MNFDGQKHALIEGRLEASRKSHMGSFPVDVYQPNTRHFFCPKGPLKLSIFKMKNHPLKRDTQAMKGNLHEGAVDKGLSPVSSALSMRVTYAC